jgi:hypothetical protein
LLNTDLRAGSFRLQYRTTHVYPGKDETVTAFTDCGIERLKQIIADTRAFSHAPRRNTSTK